MVCVIFSFKLIHLLNPLLAIILTLLGIVSSLLFSYKHDSWIKYSIITSIGIYTFLTFGTDADEGYEYLDGTIGIIAGIIFLFGVAGAWIYKAIKEEKKTN